MRVDSAATIRPMFRADVPAAADVIRRGRWGDREAFFAFAVDHPACAPFVAEVGGGLVGTGVGTSNGVSGWVGMIFVDEAWRGRGMGVALTHAVVDALHAAGCATLLLVATPMARRIYERLGFELDGAYVGLSAPGTLDGASSGHPRRGLRGVRGSDLDAICELDRAATGEDRGHLLGAVVRRGAGFVIARAPDGPVRGFALRTRWGGWPTIALHADEALRLLDRRRELTPPTEVVRTAIVESNERGLAALEARGWAQAWRGVRMRLGPSVAWNPDAIWGQFNLGLG